MQREALPMTDNTPSLKRFVYVFLIGDGRNKIKQVRRRTNQREAPGDLVYLSERKLYNLAAELGITSTSFVSSVESERSVGAGIGVSPGVQVSGNVSARHQHSDPGAPERSAARCLEEVIKGLGGDKLPNLEAPDLVYEAGWFRFHRRLRFGMGHADTSTSTRALMVVDEEYIPKGLAIPALLMTGSPQHVRPPYTSDELKEAPGYRSGSGSGYLFQWLDAARRELETDSNADLSKIEVPITNLTDHPLRDSRTAIEMYRMFTEDRWMTQPQFPQLLHGAPCEGVAQASFIAVTEDVTLVMASPLFVRIRALPKNDVEPSSAIARQWRRMMRFFGAGDQPSPR